MAIFYQKIHVFLCLFHLLFIFRLYNYYGDYLKKYTFILILLSFLYVIIHSFNSSLSDVSHISQDFIYPTKYTDISSFYGNRILYGNQNFHNGIDFLAPLGSEIYAAASGYVEYASFLEDGFGNTIILSHDLGIKTLYCHISEIFLVKVGDYVSQGDVIGYVGPKYLNNGILNGNTTGPHLHFTIYDNGISIDPLLKLKK